MAGVEMVTAPSISPEQPMQAVQALIDVARAAEVREQMSTKAEVATREVSKRQQEKLRDMVEGLNLIARSYNKNLRFQIFEETGDLFAQVINVDTGEIIKTVPPLELLEALARISDAVGLLVDKSG